MKSKIMSVINVLNRSNEAVLRRQQRLPKYLYKYRDNRSEHAFSPLEDSSLYLSMPFHFNDPTDCLLYVDSESIKEFFFDEENQFPSCAGEYLCEKGEKEDIEYSKWSSTYYSNSAIEAVNYLQGSLRVISLSETNDSPLMWAHYANEHKGFVIRYNTDDFLIDDSCGECDKQCYRKELPIFPVNYSDNRFDATEYAILYSLHKEIGADFSKCCGLSFDEIAEPISAVVQKSKDWAYEKEWRIVCKEPCKDFYSLNPDAIIIGTRANLGTWKRLIEIARQKHLQVSCSEIKHFDEKYKVSIRKLENTELDAIYALNESDSTIIESLV